MAAGREGWSMVALPAPDLKGTGSAKLKTLILAAPARCSRCERAGCRCCVRAVSPLAVWELNRDLQVPGMCFWSASSRGAWSRPPRSASLQGSLCILHKGGAVNHVAHVRCWSWSLPALAAATLTGTEGPRWLPGWSRLSSPDPGHPFLFHGT